MLLPCDKKVSIIVHYKLTMATRCNHGNKYLCNVAHTRETSYAASTQFRAMWPETREGVWDLVQISGLILWSLSDSLYLCQTPSISVRLPLSLSDSLYLCQTPSISVRLPLSLSDSLYLYQILTWLVARVADVFSLTAILGDVALFITSVARLKWGSVS